MGDTTTNSLEYLIRERSRTVRHPIDVGEQLTVALIVRAVRDWLGRYQGKMPYIISVAHAEWFYLTQDPRWEEIGRMQAGGPILRISGVPVECRDPRDLPGISWVEGRTQ